MSAVVLQLRICRECRSRVTLRGHAWCALCYDALERQIHEHRRRTCRAPEYCGNPDCGKRLRESERIAIEPGTLRCFHVHCYPQQGEVPNG